MKKSKIEWTEERWNPTTGFTKVEAEVAKALKDIKKAMVFVGGA